MLPIFYCSAVAAAATRRNGVRVRAFMASTTASEAMHEKQVSAEYTAANVQVIIAAIEPAFFGPQRPLFNSGVQRIRVILPDSNWIVCQ